jgi:hypothetical protein
MNQVKAFLSIAELKDGQDNLVTLESLLNKYSGLKLQKNNEIFVFN